MRSLIWMMWLVSAVMFAGVDDEARFLRYPDIHGDKVTFSLAGDIYIVDARGGTAHRLTSHSGKELFPKFSPDGTRIAFSGEYNGTRQVFVVNVGGGSPRQLTFYNDVGPMPPRGGFDYQVMDWTRDGKAVLFRGNRLPWGVRMGKYFTVPAEGGPETALAIPETGGGMYSPDGKKIVYTPTAREFRTWKRHRGGRAQDVWIYDLEQNKAERLTDHPMTDNQPVWIGDKIYFTSDREYTLNLFAYHLDSKSLKKVTDHQDFDVLWPSAGPRQIVYEHAGYIRKFDPQTGSDKKLTIRVLGDFPETMPVIKKVAGLINDYHISPAGKRALVGARGDIFSVPSEHGEIRNLTRSQGIRERNPSWSPDGEWVSYLSDRSGEYEIYARPQAGSGAEKRLSQGSDTWIFPPVWSPDSKNLAYFDREHRIKIITVATGENTLVDRFTYRHQTELAWSADSLWLAYSKLSENRFSVIWAYDLEKSQKHALTSGYVNNFSPAFSPDGSLLYFLSSRDYNLSFSSFEFTYIYTNATRIYAATLNDEVANPLAHRSDEIEPKETKKTEEKKAGKKKAKSEKKKEAEQDDALPTLQVAGFEDRVFVLPLDNDTYNALDAVAQGPIFAVGNNADRQIRFFDLKKRKAVTVLKGVDAFKLAPNRKKLIYRRANQLGIVEIKKGQKKKPLNLDSLEMKLNPPLEWAQIFEDGQRILSDWFYDPDMHGYDWPKLVEKYRPMVASVRSRADLDYIFSELGAELSAGHFYVNSGDEPSTARKNGGLLGAEMVADPSGYYRIAKVLPGENWHGGFRSPLLEVGVTLKAGDFILAVDQVDIRTDQNFYQALENKGNRVVTLLVNDRPEKEGARSIRVQTTTTETNLFYLEWVNARRAYVDKASGGRIGYIHLPNTAVAGNRELFKHFYAQAHKDALILDARYNGGGFIPENMIELLERPVLSYWAQRGIKSFRSPTYAHTGPKACLINGYSSSGGDAFPYYFRKRKLGKLIGTRTWGGLIGLQGNPGFADGGSLSVPAFRFYDPEGRWAVENEGVSPDIEVIDRPDLVAMGQDPSLETAVKHLLEELEKNPPRDIKRPVPPDESKRPQP